MTRSGVLGDRIVDAALVVLCVAAMVVEIPLLDTSRPSVLGFAAIAVAALPVLLHRCAPAWGLVLAMVTLVGVLDTVAVYNTAPFPAVICAFGLASRHGRRVALVSAALTVPAVLAMLQVYSPHTVLTWDTAKNLALVALPLALGVAAHDRRAYTAALLGRAEAAERTGEEETRRRVGEERLRMARDVHDVVAHAMVAINVQAGVGAHLLDRDPEQARATLRDIKKVSGTGLADLRSMLGLLRAGDGPDAPAPVHPTRGLEAIDDLRDGLGSAGVDLDVDIEACVEPLPAPVGATGYRIVQEALTNVLRHAGASTVRVRVTRAGGRVVIEVEDDGGAAATPLGSTGSGHGLRGMRERAAAVGGSLEAGPRAEGGWRVAASLPVGAP